MKGKLQAFFLAMGLMLMAISGVAQEPKRDQANLLYRSQAYQAAIEAYLKMESSGNGDMETKVRLAECHYFNRDFRNALAWMQKAIEINQLSDKYAAIYAELLRSDGQYEKADSVYQYLTQKNPQFKKVAKLMSAANIRSIADAEFDVLEIPGFNTNGDEMCPIHYKDGLVYVSSSGKKKVYAWNGRPWLNLQYIPFRPKGNEKAKSEPFKGPVNDFLHCGPASFGQQDNLMFYTRNTALRGKNEAGSANMGMYYSLNRSGKWLPVKPFKYNSKKFSMGHPALFNNGKEMYFVSDMPGGYGGADIYYTKFTGNTWTTPVNLGPAVNTEKHELFPYVDEEGTLYFSSEGHTGFGGLDIFKSKLKDGVWSQPVNLGKPVNSGYDDFGITLDKNRKSGYFTSNRPGGQGNDDVYRLALKGVGKEVCTFKLGGMVSDRVSLQPIERANVSLKLPDGNTVSVASDTAGNYEYSLLCEMATVKLRVEATGYFPKEQEMKREAGTAGLLVNFNLDKIELNKSIVVPDIYYDLDKYDIKPEAARELDKLVDLLQRNPSWIVELASHTDSRADEQYNLRLSRKRAAVAVEYLVSKGIPSERLYAKGYGESKLLNECKEGIRCNEEKHAQNRRTEFRLIGYDKFSYQEEGRTVEAERVIFAPEYQQASSGVTYKIQIGLYKNPDKATLNKFSDLGRVVVQNVDETGMQRYVLESYGNHATALGYLKKVQERGLADAFLLAFKDGKPITIEEAKKMEGK